MNHTVNTTPDILKITPTQQTSSVIPCKDFVSRVSPTTRDGLEQGSQAESRFGVAWDHVFVVSNDHLTSFERNWVLGKRSWPQ